MDITITSARNHNLKLAVIFRAPECSLTSLAHC